MSHATKPPHRSLLTSEMEQIRETAMLMGQAVETAIVLATTAFADRDAETAAAVVRDDERLNDMQRTIRELCFNVILTQAPVARDLREIMGFFHMSAELERMGDHCKSIAREAVGLADLPPLATYPHLRAMADLCAAQVRDVLEVLVTPDVERAREVCRNDAPIDEMYRNIVAALVEMMTDDGHTIYRATRLIFVAHHLERIGDRVTNVAEDLIFLETGVIEELG